MRWSTAWRNDAAAAGVTALHILAAMPQIATVDVPASSANLGSGFDCFAAALSLKLRAELYEGDEPGIVLNARGEGAETADGPGRRLDRRQPAYRPSPRATLSTAGGARHPQLSRGDSSACGARSA
jgi:hypothetical protein